MGIRFLLRCFNNVTVWEFLFCYASPLGGIQYCPSANTPLIFPQKETINHFILPERRPKTTNVVVGTNTKEGPWFSFSIQKSAPQKILIDSALLHTSSPHFTQHFLTHKDLRIYNLSYHDSPLNLPYLGDSHYTHTFPLVIFLNKSTCEGIWRPFTSELANKHTHTHRAELYHISSGRPPVIFQFCKFFLCVMMQLGVLYSTINQGEWLHSN